MTVSLFIPCYVDQFFPEVGVATLQVLERLGCTVDFDPRQSCCGQPMANSGAEQAALPVYRNFIDVFAEADYIVCPSGSCVHHIREHYDILGRSAQGDRVRSKTYELCEFIVDILGNPLLEGSLNARVGLHQSCHGLRGLRLASDSERNETPFDKVRTVLRGIKGLTYVELSREDECCGFGGTFAVAQEALSVRMGKDRLADHMANGANVIASADMSCLMHLGGLAKRENLGIEFMHVAQLLTAANPTFNHAGESRQHLDTAV